MRFSRVVVPVNWKDLLSRTYRETLDDHCFGLAAELAFYFVLALFPALLFLVAMISVLPVEHVFEEWLVAIEPFAPRDIVALIRSQLEELARGNSAGLLTIGLLGAIWSSSAAMMAIISTLNRAYDIQETRPWWKARFLAIALTMAFAISLIAASVLLLIGPGLFSWVADWVGWSDFATALWAIVRWPLMLLLVVLGVDVIYYFAPNTRSEWVWITPGSLLATALWLGASFGLKYYVQNFADFNATYGTIGGAILLLLWFYLSGLAILVGAELNAEIERQSMHHQPRDDSAQAAGASQPKRRLM